MKRKNGSIRNGKTEKTMMNDVPAHPTNHLVLFGLIQQIHMVDPDLVASRRWHQPCSHTTTALRTHAFLFAFFSPASALTSSRGRTPHTAPFSLPASLPLSQSLRHPTPARAPLIIRHRRRRQGPSSSTPSTPSHCTHTCGLCPFKLSTKPCILSVQLLAYPCVPPHLGHVRPAFSRLELGVLAHQQARGAFLARRW